MRYLAVPEMPRRHLLVTFLRRTYWMPRWHAVTVTTQPNVNALCGFRYRSEPHRTWDQSTLATRCPKCERLVTSDRSMPTPERPPRAHAPEQWPRHPIVSAH